MTPVTISSRFALAVLAVVPAWTCVAGPVSMHLTPNDQTICVGAIVEIDLVVSADGAQPQPFDALDAVLSWDPNFLRLLGVDDSNAEATFFVSDFLPDPDDVNEDLEDGDAIYTALMPPGQTAMAPPVPGDLVITTFLFEALAETPLTEVDLLTTIGMFGQSRVLLSGANITGTVGGPAGVTEFLSCTGDVNCDGVVDVLDLIEVILLWGTDDLPADINNDGVVNVEDLVLVILNWGPCP